MKTTLFHFSGTGNSLKVARDLARELDNAELRPIARLPAGPVPADADRVGLVFPVYAWGPPAIVADFAQRLEVGEQAYVFGVVTCGGMPGGTLNVLRDLLERRGIRLAAGFAIRMPSNYTPLSGPPAPAVQQKLFAAEAREVVRVAGLVKAGAQPGVRRGNRLTNVLFTRLIYRFTIARFAQADKSFRVDARCNGCGVCARVCPVGNIELREGRPHWLHRCQQCVACLQWCPQEAIQFGQRTEKRARYHHPEARASDFMAAGAG